MTGFIAYPLLAFVLGGAFAGAWLWRGARSAAAAGLLWMLYGGYEYLMHFRVLCSGECNIRVDLLLIYPLLLALSLAGLWNTVTRSTSTQEKTSKPIDAPPRYRNFREFYPFYLSEHANRTSRRLHFVGTSIAAMLVVAAMITQAWWLIGAAVVQGYAFAWVGHFFFEHNRPATFRYPGLSFIGDWRLWWDMLTRRIPF